METSQHQEVAKAAAIFERLKDRVSAESAELEAAEKTLKGWFAEHPEAQDFEGRIRCTRSSRKQLDIGAVRAHLGDEAERFMRQAPTLGLKLVHPAVRGLSQVPDGVAEPLREATCGACGELAVASFDLRPVLEARGWQLGSESTRCPACR